MHLRFFTVAAVAIGGCLMAIHFVLKDRRHSAVSVDTACRLACSFQCVCICVCSVYSVLCVCIVALKVKSVIYIAISLQ